MTDSNVAIFLDVENLSGWLKAEGGKMLLDYANKLGSIVVRRAYGDFSIQSVSARQPELNLLGFDFVHVYHPAKGKNSTDIQIVVDVMDYLVRIPDLEWVILATGDSDFSPLFRRLRELGKSVVGIGPRSPLSNAVENSCNQFIYTDQDPIVSQEPSIPTKTLPSPSPSTLPTTLGHEISAQEKALSQNGAGNSSGNNISAKNSSKKKAATVDSAVSSAAASDQSQADGLSVLKKALHKFPEGINISTLKGEMLAID
ncbi:MAG TPA: NYN domain-containing protein, partial [Chroococcidiopsis sp.]